MSIGQAGKKAKAMGQQHVQRYQVAYSEADTTPLHGPAAPSADASNRSIQRTADHSATTRSHNQQPIKPANPSVNRPSNSAPATIQRDENTAVDSTAERQTSDNNSSEGHSISPKDVADEVYKMLTRDLRIERERRGRRR